MSSAAPHNPSDLAAHNVAAIVLAAGLSSRMGRCKPLLPLGDGCVLERTISLFRANGIREILIVLGHRADTLRPLAERNGARCVLNEHYHDGMYSSFVTACRALPPSVNAAFILPADMPLIRPVTVQMLLAHFISAGPSVLYPVFAQRRGHPPLIARSILDEAARGAPGPLSFLLQQHASESLDVPVFDAAIHSDMDTPADYNTLRTWAYSQDIPTEEECEALLQVLDVPPIVVRHARAVTAIAITLTAALAAHGLLLDASLVRAGALLHDIAKGEPQHAEAGAERLHTLGFKRVATIVAAHTNLSDFSTLDERAVVFLADKLVRNDQTVSLDERFAPALQRFKDQPQALAAAQQRQQTARRVASEVEHLTGIPLADLLRQEVRS